MDPVTLAIMLLGAGVSLGAIVNYVTRLVRKDTNVQIKIGAVEVSVKGPISQKKAQDIVHAISESHVLDQ